MRAIIDFLKEAKVELAKVSWPDRAKVFRYTVTVVVLSVAVAAFLGTLDWFFSFFVKEYFIQ